MRTARTAAVLALVLAASACGRSHPTAPEAEQPAAASSPDPALPDLTPRKGGVLIGSGS